MFITPLGDNSSRSGLPLPRVKVLYPGTGESSEIPQGSIACSAISAVGQDDLLHCNCAMGLAACTGPAVIPAPLSEVRLEQFTDKGKGATKGDNILSLVEVPGDDQGMLFQWLQLVIWRLSGEF
uniref:Uncharacterized protein n=1 Tax=Micrurus spixii TaxID=129469 RepID=A0A2D4MER2_9SAUR